MTDWRPSCSVPALRARAALTDEVRGFFAERGVLEVQTPVLGRHTVTDPAIDSLRCEDGGYLQTSPEYHMKRLLAAGAPSIYRIGPAFRRGEAGRWHNPEFTMVEWYRLGFDAPRLMDEVAELVNAALGEAPYRQLAYADILRRRFGIDHDDAKAVLDGAERLGLPAGSNLADARDLLLADALAAIGGRVFVTRFPAAQAALARLNDDGCAERFELVCDGLELANGYHELTDAKQLQSRMTADAATRRRRGLAGVAADEALLAAHRHGLPECAGVALGFDRLLALRLKASSLAETLPFDWRRA